MGCASSTEVVTDPHTGQAKKKKKLGGAYPGQRRPEHAPYTPGASQFGKDGQATAHFVAHGGGNALTLVQSDGTHQPQVGQAQPSYIEVTLPDGVESGQTIHVQAPDGRVNAIVIPPGFGPGSTFTVEFAPDVTSAPAAASASSNAPMAPAAYTTNTAPSPNDPMAKPADGYYGGYGTTAATAPTAPTATAYPANANYTPPPSNLPDSGFATGFGR